MLARPPDRRPASRSRPLLVGVADDGARIELPCRDADDSARKKGELVAALDPARVAALTWWYYPDPATVSALESERTNPEEESDDDD